MHTCAKDVDHIQLVPGNLFCIFSAFIANGDVPFKSKNVMSLHVMPLPLTAQFFRTLNARLRGERTLD